VALLPAGSYTEIVNKEVPVFIESPREHSEHELLEILWSVSRSEGQASRQPTAACREHRHLLTGLRLIIHLVEAFLEVSNRDIGVPCYGTLDVLGIGNEEIFTDRDLVQLTIVHN
jgi:hypothetical protein